MTVRRWLVAVILAAIGVVALATPAAAQIEPTPPPVPQVGDEEPITVDEEKPFVITIDDGSGGPSQSVIIIVALTLLSLAPSLLIMLTSFTRIIVVLSLTRNAIGLQGVPPNQVLVGISLFLTLFVMSPTLTEINDTALQPYLDGQLEQAEAFETGAEPLRAFMLEHTRESEIELMLDATEADRPEEPSDVPLSTLIPAFLLSELKTAFLIGFVIFIPFLVIDVVVSAVLMSLGMMMLPPVFVSLPFKLLLFVMVGGWSLIVETLLTSFV
ncbi:MAG: flagellar type III secretion system pore protein FliP [Acidimicrobiia bacterium]|nr:flagellar type III secretion system pore protein FliP [Acidimicrobiia bacterium]MDH5520057.1 flagellar type III secretion system pore protein FliP [Acidimicrobiia bacterium]